MKGHPWGSAARNGKAIYAVRGVHPPWPGVLKGRPGSSGFGARALLVLLRRPRKISPLRRRGDGLTGRGFSVPDSLSGEARP